MKTRFLALSILLSAGLPVAALVFGQAAAAQTALRAEIQNLRQLVVVSPPAPRDAKGSPVYCDTVGLSLLLAHSEEKAEPIIVHSIRVQVADVDPSSLPLSGICKVDRFSSNPHGIIEKNVYFFRIDESAVTGRYLKDANSAERIDQDNILEYGGTRKAIVLTRGEAPIAFDISFQNSARTAKQVTFTIDYDDRGERKIITRPFVLR
jgi:hypothetical protein